MDQKLLNALSNIGDALEELVDALNSKQEAKSATATAIQSGDFSKDLKSITDGIKSIKADTQTIIKNQQTIIAQGKERESAKTKDIETDPKKESDIKKGVGTILLIAVAVLAIGAAFKLVGNVNVLSVIGLALAITLISIAFEKVSKLGLTLKDSAITSGVLVIVSAAIMLSSHILGLVSPVSPLKMLTAIFIAGGFALLGPSIGKLIGSIKGMGVLDLIKTVIFLPLILPAISLGIALSSTFLQDVKPIGLSQFISSILVTGIFVAVSFGIKNMLGAFKGINPVAIILASLFLPTILVSVSKAIADSSGVLSNVKPISLSAFFGAILISLVFVVLSFGLKKIISAFSGVNPATAAIAAISIPILMVAMSYAIMESSDYLSDVTPISMGNFLTSIAISVVFIGLSIAASFLIRKFRGLGTATVVAASITIPILMVAMSYSILKASEFLSEVTPISFAKLLTSILISGVFIGLSFAVSFLIKKLKGIDPATAATAAVLIPTLMVTMSVAIWLSSKILSDVTPVDDAKLINAGIIGGGLAIITLAIIPGIKLLSKVKKSDILKGALGVVIIAATIMASSLIISLGKYDGDFPKTDWIKGVSISILVFGLATIGMGALITASAGLGLPALVLGALGVVIIAATIRASSHILKLGDYKTSYPSLDWAKGVSLSLAAFSTGMVVLGTIIFASFGLGLGMLAAGSKAVLMVAKTIVSASNILAEGYTDEKGVKFTPKYTGGPTKEWAEGVALALGAFSPIYTILAKNSGWFKSGISPGDFSEAIKTVSSGIVTAAESLSKDNIWVGGPKKEWAEGVGLALGAFSPVFEILSGQTWFSKSVDAEDMKKAISTISEGIVEAAVFFSENTSPFEEGNYPSKKWGEGVGGALGAFSPVFEALMGKKWYQSGKDVVGNMVLGIRTISSSIVDSAKAFGGYYYDVKENKWVKSEALSGMWDTYPKIEWVDGVKKSLIAFLDIFKYLDKGGYSSKNVNRLYGTLNSMVKSAKILWYNKKFFTVDIDPEFSVRIKKILESFNTIGDSFNRKSSTSATSALNSIIKFAKIVFKNKEFLNVGIDTSGIMNIISEGGLIKSYINILDYLSKIDQESINRGIGISESIASKMAKMAEILFGNSDIFGQSVDFSGFMSAISNPGVISEYIKLAESLNEIDDDIVKIGIPRTRYISYSLVRVAKALLSGKEAFENIPDFTSFSGAISTSGIIDMFSKLAEGLYGIDRDSFYFGMFRSRRATLSMVRIAKLLFKNKDFFGETDIYGQFYTDVISPSGIIRKYTNLIEYLANIEGDSLYGGIRRGRKIATSLVSLAKIINGGKDYFNTLIDPDYVKNVGQNMIDFNELVKKLIESEDGGLLKNLGDKILGNDPVIQIAKRMITLAEGYDKLADSLIKLSTAMRLLNISDVRMIGGLGGAKSNESVEMLNDERRAEMINVPTQNTMPTLNIGKGGAFGTSSEETTLKDDLKEIIKLLTNIDKSSIQSSEHLDDVKVILGEDNQISIVDAAKKNK
jgi:hypothetical protein